MSAGREGSAARSGEARRGTGSAGDARRGTRSAGDDPPPFLGAWRNLYALVIAAHVVVIALLAWLTHRFS
ncbi:MAG TPA: hypothetical protein VGK89_13870 [Candidatus Eisenbacteria bacterium]